ncbi:MAG: caspase family protein, partial [Fervidobacterium sp.]
FSVSTNKPVRASDVELVKKVTVKGKPQGGKPSPTAATGTLGDQCTGTKYAIVIGINDYPGTANDLQYCVYDANSMVLALEEVYGYSSANIAYITNSGATHLNITNAVNTVKEKAKSGDEVFFFFSGHGAKGKADDGDNETVDESIVIWGDDGNFGYLWDGELKHLFEYFPTNRIIFAFDSCLSGGMTDLAADGRVINMACSESGVSYEFESLGHGQFTYYFVVKGMLDEEADTNTHDGSVTVEEAFDYAKANCVYQKPTISDSFFNDLLP